MTKLTLTRFKRTAGGYRRNDSNEWEGDASFAFLLNQVFDYMREHRRHDEPTAISFSNFLSGRMSGETFRGATAIVLEYMLGTDAVARLEEIRRAADKLDKAYYLLVTETRYGQPTITLVFPLTETVSAARYSRIASVLATQLDLFEAAPGIQAHTHLCHVGEDSAAEFNDGLTIDPDRFIKQTEHEAQYLDPLQFERARPAKVAVLVEADWTGLFEGLN